MYTLTASTRRERIGTLLLLTLLITGRRVPEVGAGVQELSPRLRSRVCGVWG